MAVFLFDPQMVFPSDCSSVEFAALGHKLLNGGVRWFLRTDTSCKSLCVRLGQSIQKIHPERTIHLELDTSQVGRNRLAIRDDDAVDAILLASQREVVALDLLELVNRKILKDHPLVRAILLSARFALIA